MKRWLRELFHPSEKCARVGHRWTTERRRGIEKPSDDPGWPCFFVADNVVQERTICGRCRHGEDAEWVTVDRNGIHSLTMPSDQMAKLKETGFLRTG